MALVDEELKLATTTSCVPATVRGALGRAFSRGAKVAPLGDGSCRAAGNL